MKKIAFVAAETDFRLKSSRRQDATGLTIGHGEFRYRVDPAWGTPDAHQQFPVKDCHEMAIDSSGLLYVLTNHPKNNVLIYNADGTVLRSWSLGLEGAHGLTLSREGDEEFLYITDCLAQSIHKTTLSGRVLGRLPSPHDLGIFDGDTPYLPTGTAVSGTGDVYVADGYGSSRILQFTSRGDFVRDFGGRTAGPDSIGSAHGIAIDTRGDRESLLVTSREDARIKRFTLDGKYLEDVSIPGAFLCRPVIHGTNLFAAVCWSHKLYAPNTGFVTILDEADRVVSNPGGVAPLYVDGELSPLRQAEPVFRHCHDVCIDRDENLYVCEWNAAGRHPMKLERVR